MPQSEDQEVTIELRAGRGVDGYTATLDISPKSIPDAEPVPVAAVVPKAELKPYTKPTLTAGIKPKPKAVVTDEPEGTNEPVKFNNPVEEEGDGSDDGSDDEMNNSMVNGSRDDEPPMHETAEAEPKAEIPAPAPRSIFSKARA